MNWENLLHSFDLHNDLLVNQDVQAKSRLDHLLSIDDRESDLIFNHKPVFTHFCAQAGFVNGF